MIMVLTETEFVIRLVAAFAFGFGIGFERRTKAAGIRTFILIALGSAAFTMIPMLPQFGGFNFDSMRMMSQIIVGIGFIGAGVVWKHHNEFSGITTAATIWTSAAVGMLTGVGELTLAFILALLMIIVLYSKKYTAPPEATEDEYLEYQATGMGVLRKKRKRTHRD